MPRAQANRAHRGVRGADSPADRPWLYRPLTGGCESGGRPIRHPAWPNRQPPVMDRPPSPRRPPIRSPPWAGPVRTVRHRRPSAGHADRHHRPGMGSAPPPIQSSFRVGSHRWRLVLAAGGRGAFRIAVSTDCGVIPYTAEDAAARAALLVALPELGGLPLARIVGDRRPAAARGRRLAGRGRDDAPRAVIYELIRFLREARPIADLLSSLQAR